MISKTILAEVRGLTIYMFQSHTIMNEHGEEVAQLIAPTDCNGLFPSHETWQELAYQAWCFYDCVTPAEIDSINAHTLSQQELRQEQCAANRPASRQAPGYVYLLEGMGRYKIGSSTNVNRRIEQISPRLPFEARLVCSIWTENMYKLESTLHKLFADKRLCGEWFKLSDEDVAYIKEAGGVE